MVDTWQLSFAGRTPVERNEIYNFLLARRGVEAFQWTTPFNQTAAFVCPTFNLSLEQCDYGTVTATFELQYVPGGPNLSTPAAPTTAFNIAPDFTADLLWDGRGNVMQLGDGYRQRVTFGAYPWEETWRLQFLDRTNAERDTIREYLRGARGVTGFSWTDPRSGNVGKYACSEWNVTYNRFNGNDITATFRRVFEVGTDLSVNAPGANLPITFTLSAGGATTSWSPASTTTALWLDAADASTVTSSGGSPNDVTEWRDKSGNARHVSDLTPAPNPDLRPTYVPNGLGGLAVIDFPGGGGDLTSTSPNSTWNFLHDATGSSIFVVAKAGITSNPNDIYGIVGNYSEFDGSGRLGLTLYYDDRSTSFNNAVRSISGSSGGRTTYNDVWTPNEYQMIGLLTDYADPTPAQRRRTHINGGNALTTSNFGGSARTGDANFTLSVGGGGGGTNILRGGIAEVIIVEGAVTTANRQRFEGYLAHKWGLTAKLPSDHPYKTTAP